MTTPKGTVSYAYDAKNRLTTITDPVFGAFRFLYDGMDRRTELDYPNGVKTSYQYDQAYRLTALASKDTQGNVLDAWSYTYDAVGNRLSKTDMNGANETYQYDPVYRLTHASYGDGSYESFSYDPAGNRLTRVTSSGTTGYTYDAANQMLTAGTDGFTYDGNGNQLTHLQGTAFTSYAYDWNNRLVSEASPAGTETSQYAPDGSRVDLHGPNADPGNASGEIGPQYDTIGNPILDMSTANAVNVYRVYGPGIDEPLAEWRAGNTQTSYLLHDALNSVTAVTTSQGAVSYRQSFKAFGARTQTALPTGMVSTRLSYTSRENALGSLMFNRARFYDTASGRFMSNDTYRGQETSPPSLHRYVYAINNPVRYTDPSGMISPDPGPMAFILIGTLLTLIVFAYAILCTFKSADAGQRTDCLSAATAPLVKDALAVDLIGYLVFAGTALDLADALLSGDLDYGGLAIMILIGA